MVKCNECPFLTEGGGIYDAHTDYPICALGYTPQEVIDTGNTYSEDCKLDLVQYTLKDQLNSITFIPREEK